MTSAASELQRAVFEALSQSADLTDAIGAGRIYDHVPAQAEFPYITFGRTTIQDWSTSSEDGTEHIFTLHFWSKEKGKAQALRVMEIARALLHDTALPLENYALVNLRREFEDVRFDDDQDVYHGLLRFRAVVEPSNQ